jgi:hypothetical protein
VGLDEQAGHLSCPVLLFRLEVMQCLQVAQQVRPAPGMQGIGDLLPITQHVLKESLHHREAWSSLEAYTEAAWVRRARDGNWPETGYWTSPRHQLVCKPDLDLHTGTTGIYRRRHGNMRRDGARAVLKRGLADGPVTQEQLYFPGPAPSISELATLAGDAGSMAIHFDAASVRYLWLDRQRQTR